MRSRILNARHPTATPDFTFVTEVPQSRASAEQAAILYTRYDLASRYSEARNILEVACGTGIGIGLLATNARSVAAGDIEPKSCDIARRTYAGRQNVSICRLSAESLPFENNSFDLVLLFEALYYLRDPALFFDEARRILRPGGMLLISTVNRDWPGFNPSPCSTYYFSACELAADLSSRGYSVQLLAGFPDRAGGWLSGIVRVVRRVAIRLHMIPKTMQGKELLKRLFYGQLRLLPAELSVGFAEPQPLTEVSPDMDCSSFKFIYAMASKTVPE